MKRFSAVFAVGLYAELLRPDTRNCLDLPRAALHLFGLIAKRLCMTSRFFRIIRILVILFPSVTFADDFKTANGKEYKNCTVTRVEPDGIVIKFSGGIVKIPFTDLSQDLQQKYHYDPAAAASYAAADAAAQQRFAQEQTEQHQRAAAERAARKRAADEAVTRRNAHILREVRSDPRSFFDQPFTVEGKIDVSDYYNWGYRDAEPTHYSFELRTADGSFNAYMEREGAAALRQRLVENGGAVRGSFTVVVLSNRYRKNSELLLELLAYTVQ